MDERMIIALKDQGKPALTIADYDKLNTELKEHPMGTPF